MSSGSEYGRSTTILDFRAGDQPWFPQNDGVMGGMSSSALRFDEGRAVFEGHVSFENNGGFASVGIRVEPVDLAAFREIEVRARGDGKLYQLRLRSDDGWGAIAYRAHFRPEPGKWSTISIPLSSFEPTRRGQRLDHAPPLLESHIRQVGFLIGDRQEGPFRLEVEWVGAAGWGVESGSGEVAGS